MSSNIISGIFLKVFAFLYMYHTGSKLFKIGHGAHIKVHLMKDSLQKTAGRNSHPIRRYGLVNLGPTYPAPFWHLLITCNYMQFAVQWFYSLIRQLSTYLMTQIRIRKVNNHEKYRTKCVKMLLSKNRCNGKVPPLAPKVRTLPNTP